MTEKTLAPTFNLKAVLKETGLKADTLRAWERRYGLPEPERSSGGHRLFSLRDIDTLKWLITRQEEGLSISRAVDLWRSMEEQGQDPLQIMPMGPAPDTHPFSTGVAVNKLRHSWIQACKAFDEHRAEQLLTQAFAQFPPEIVCIEILVKGLSEIGEGWYNNEISVQQEHLASTLATRRIEALLTAAPTATYPGTVLILCPPDDEHTFSPLVLTYLLRRRGRMAIFLGANVPFARFETVLQKMKPQLVVMTAQDLRTAAALLPFSTLLDAEGIPFAFGGLAFNQIPQLKDRILGHFLGNSIIDAPDAIKTILSKRQPYAEVASTSTDYLQTYTRFMHQKGAVLAHLSSSLEINETQPIDIANANLHLTEDILAALQLGDMRLLSPNLGWIKGLLHNHGVEPAALDAYINAYQESIQHVLGDDGKIVIDFLEKSKSASV